MKFPIKLLGTRYWELCLIANMGKVSKQRFVSLNLPIDKIQHPFAHPAPQQPNDVKDDPVCFINCQTLNQIFFPRSLTFHQNPLQVTLRVNEENYLLHFL